VLAKIRSQLPASALDYFAGLEQRFHVRRTGATDYRRHAEAISVLSAAAREDRWVRLKYSSLWRSAAYEMDFAPYGLVYYEGDLFAVGFSAPANAIRVLKITRVQSVTATENSFKRPEDFRLDEHFRPSFGIVSPQGPEVEIEVLFPEAALVEERLWPGSQQHEWLPGEPALFETDEPGQLRATFRLSNTIEFKRWLKGFGAAAEVVKPEWLRQELRAEFEAAAARYA
jgi:predicted DNA-binding transcriptional regulator YafY